MASQMDIRRSSASALEMLSRLAAGVGITPSINVSKNPFLVIRNDVSNFIFSCKPADHLAEAIFHTETHEEKLRKLGIEDIPEEDIQDLLDSVEEMSDVYYKIIMEDYVPKTLALDTVGDRVFQLLAASSESATPDTGLKVSVDKFKTILMQDLVEKFTSASGIDTGILERMSTAQSPTRSLERTMLRAFTEAAKLAGTSKDIPRAPTKPKARGK